MKILTKITERLERNTIARVCFIIGCVMFPVSILLYWYSIEQNDGYLFIIGLIFAGLFMTFVVRPEDEEE